MKVEVMMDSGAAEAVCGPDDFPALAVVDDPGRKSHGAKYVCADGGTIPNLGENKVHGYTSNGTPMAVTYQVAPVDRPILVACKTTQAGHQVWFGERGGAN